MSEIQMQDVERILDAVFGQDREQVPTPADVAKRPRVRLTVTRTTVYRTTVRRNMGDRQ